jgi:DNA-binding GntR family transcriptional regulator
MKFDLDNSRPGYVYKTMAEHIRARIESGELKPHTPLPGERRLAEEYGVSLGTARRATKQLRDWGLVVTLRSLGTFIAAPAKQADEPTIGATVYSMTTAQGRQL